MMCRSPPPQGPPSAAWPVSRLCLSSAGSRAARSAARRRSGGPKPADLAGRSWQKGGSETAAGPTKSRQPAPAPRPPAQGTALMAHPRLPGRAPHTRHMAGPASAVHRAGRARGRKAPGVTSGWTCPHTIDMAASLHRCRPFDPGRPRPHASARTSPTSKECCWYCTSPSSLDPLQEPMASSHANPSEDHATTRLWKSRGYTTARSSAATTLPRYPCCTPRDRLTSTRTAGPHERLDPDKSASDQPTKHSRSRRRTTPF
mmetsp:Transcript_176129/g.559632  ORF Transcript_176129/g.559632 Transcript_176129/m.559632 type:complete len:259 (+) Transcript_176129:3-779(+)